MKLKILLQRNSRRACHFVVVTNVHNVKGITFNVRLHHCRIAGSRMYPTNEEMGLKSNMIHLPNLQLKNGLMVESKVQATLRDQKAP